MLQRSQPVGNHAMFFSRTTGVNLLLATSLVMMAGCGSVDTTNATTLNLFREGGPTPDKEALASVNQRKDLKDILFRIKSGDVVQIYIEKSGDLFELVTTEPARLTFTQDLYAYMNKDGLFLSPDGDQFVSVDKFIDGSVNVHFSMEESSRENRLAVTLSTNIAD